MILEASERSGRAAATYPLKDLLAPDILQPRVQVLDLLDQRLYVCLVCALNPACLSDSHVERELDRTVNAMAHPSSTRDVLRGDANAVLSRIGGAEGEFALARTTLGNDTVVVVECLLNGYEDAGVRTRYERLGRVTPYFSMVMA